MDVLERAYGKIFNLHEYVTAILEDASEKLSQNTKKPGFQKIIKKTLVGISSDKTPKKSVSVPLASENEDQMAVVEEVVKELLNGGHRTNVLTLGLPRNRRGDVALPFYPDHNYTQLITPFWSKILNIIGKVAMKELLLNTSIFVEAESACYIQLSGDPVHTAISIKNNVSTSSDKAIKPKPSVPSSSPSYSESDEGISALSLCYDKGWYRTLQPSHPLSYLPASNSGARRLVHEIFQKESGGRISKSKRRRVPDRLRRSKDILKKLLGNFKKVRLEAFHESAKEESKPQKRKRDGVSRTSSLNLADDARISRGAFETSHRNPMDVPELLIKSRVQMESSGEASNSLADVNSAPNKQTPAEEVSDLVYGDGDCSIAVKKDEAKDKVEETIYSDAGGLGETGRSNKSNSDERDRSVEIFSSPEKSDLNDRPGIGEKETVWGSGGKTDPVAMETTHHSDEGAITVESSSDPEDLELIEVGVEDEINLSSATISAELSTESGHNERNVEKVCLVLSSGGNDSEKSVGKDSDLSSKERHKEDITGLSGLSVEKESLLGKSTNIRERKRCREEINDQSDRQPKKLKRDDFSRERNHDCGSKSDSAISSDVIDLLSSSEHLDSVDENFANGESLQMREASGEIKDTSSHQSGAIIVPGGCLGGQDDVTTSPQNGRIIVPGGCLGGQDDVTTSPQSGAITVPGGYLGGKGDVPTSPQNGTVIVPEGCLGGQDDVTTSPQNGTVIVPGRCLGGQDDVTIEEERVQTDVTVTGSDITVIRQCKNDTTTRKCRKKRSTLKSGCDVGTPLPQSARREIIDNLKERVRRRLKERTKKNKKRGVRNCQKEISIVRRNSLNFDRNRSEPTAKIPRRKLRESKDASLTVGYNSVNRGPNETILRRYRNNMVAQADGRVPQVYGSTSRRRKNLTKCQKTCRHGNTGRKQHSTACCCLNERKENKLQRKKSVVPREDSPLAAGLTGTEVSVSLRGLLRKIVPMETWGSTSNQNQFFKYIRHLVKLGRFEKVPLNLLKESITISDCQWSRSNKEDWKKTPKSDQLKRKELVETMFRWLITDLVVPLIRLQYYVTETSNSKNELVYFPKKNGEEWKKQPLLETVHLMVVQQSTLGKSKLRFIPKEKGFRPIVRLGKSTLPGKEKFDINFLLRDVLDVLNYLKRVHPELFGFSILGVTSIYPKWKVFTMRRKKEGDTRPLYFVKIDISKCYDSIPHDKLFEVMARHLKQKDLPQTYAIRRYTVTTVTGQGDVRKKLKRYVSPEEGKHYDPRSCQQILMDLAKDGVHHKSIITNQASFHVEGVDSLLNRLQHLIYNDILSINRRDFVRTKGISHGSVLSSLLCSMFYGYMEKTCLEGIDKDGLLMRLIDDFILVTPHLDSATKFIQKLFSSECTDTFGFCINPSKTLTNFKHVYEGQQLQQVKDEDWFPWCGFLFNMKTLEAKNDYLRYEASSFRYSMTVSFKSDDIMKAMKMTLTQALLRSKGLLIFVDPLINSPMVIIENVYNLLLLTAFRFHSYFQALPQQLRKHDSGSLLEMILAIASSYYMRAKKSLSRLPEKSVLPLSSTAIKWLCVKAFHVKLSRHFSVHKRLVVRLKQKRNQLTRMLDKDTRRALAKGSVPDIPAAFVKTRF